LITLSRTFLAAPAAAFVTILAACSQPADAPAQKAEAGAAAAPALTVTNPRVVLAPVSGNPAAVYFDLAYAGPAGVSLTGVDVEGAGMTMIHDYAEDAGKMKMVMADSVPLTAGSPISFKSGGLHVMLMDPGSGLAPGSTAKVTLTLSDGTTMVIEAPVRAAGDER
jgi:copper(I)-binding protein